MRRAGFKKLYPISDGFVWGRGDIKIATGLVPISLERLIGYVIDAAVQQDRKNSKIVNSGFATKNN